MSRVKIIVVGVGGMNGVGGWSGQMEKEVFDHLANLIFSAFIC